LRFDRLALHTLIEGGLLIEATVSQVLVSEYADHLPPYRKPRFMPGRSLISIARPWPVESAVRLYAAAGA
jgi:hypothetical protein